MDSLQQIGRVVMSPDGPAELLHVSRPHPSGVRFGAVRFADGAVAAYPLNFLYTTTQAMDAHYARNILATQLRRIGYSTSDKGD